MHLPTEDTVYMSKTSCWNSWQSSTAADVRKLILNDISTGAKSDIDRASKIARAMVVEYGMSEVIGNLSFGSGDEVFLGRDMGKAKAYSNQMGDLIDKEVKNLVDHAYDKAEAILKEKISLLHLVAKALLEKETLQTYEFEALYTEGKLPEPLSEIEVRNANDKIIKQFTDRKNRDYMMVDGLTTPEFEG